MITNLVHQSVDGFICGPNGEFDWPVFGAEMSAYANEASDRASAFLYGRGVWELMSYYWPTADEKSTDPHDVRFAKTWREKPKIVVSTKLTEADWNTTVVAGPDELAALPGDKIMFGGSELAASLTGRGMIGEYLVFVHPVVLGGGKPTFLNPADRVNFDLAESRVLDDKVVLLRYQR
jgi:dihydrofolate reductase